MGNQPICVCTCVLFHIRVRANRFVPSCLRTYVLAFVCVCVYDERPPRDIRMSQLWYVPDSLRVLEELKCHRKERSRSWRLEINTAELCMGGEQMFCYHRGSWSHERSTFTKRLCVDWKTEMIRMSPFSGCNTKPASSHSHMKPSQLFRNETNWVKRFHRGGKGHKKKTAKFVFRQRPAASAISVFHLLSIIWCLSCFKQKPVIKNASVWIKTITRLTLYNAGHLHTLPTLHAHMRCSSTCPHFDPDHWNDAPGRCLQHW